MHVFYIYAKEKYSNKICKYKSLHEINFILNERLDSVFIQQHMHTHLSFPTSVQLVHSTAVWPSCLPAYRSKRTLKNKQTRWLWEHDAKYTNAWQRLNYCTSTCKTQHDWACLLTDSESNLCTQTIHLCLMPWLSMGNTW